MATGLATAMAIDPEEELRKLQAKGLMGRAEATPQATSLATPAPVAPVNPTPAQGVSLSSILGNPQVIRSLAAMGSAIGGQGSVAEAIGGAATGMVDAQQGQQLLSRTLAGEDLSTILSDPALAGVSQDSVQTALSVQQQQRENELAERGLGLEERRVATGERTAEAQIANQQIENQLQTRSLDIAQGRLSLDEAMGELRESEFMASLDEAQKQRDLDYYKAKLQYNAAVETARISSGDERGMRDALRFGELLQRDIAGLDERVAEYQDMLRRTETAIQNTEGSMREAAIASKSQIQQALGDLRTRRTTMETNFKQISDRLFTAFQDDITTGSSTRTTTTTTRQTGENASPELEFASQEAVRAAKPAAGTIVNVGGQRFRVATQNGQWGLIPL